MILNDEIADAFGRPSFNFYANIKGFFEVNCIFQNLNNLPDFQKFNNAAELAAAYKFSEFNFRKTLETYNGFWEKQKNGDSVKDEFGKTVFPAKFRVDQTIYIAQLTPAIHYTMGGLKIDRNARLNLNIR